MSNRPVPPPGYFTGAMPPSDLGVGTVRTVADAMPMIDQSTGRKIPWWADKPEPDWSVLHILLFDAAKRIHRCWNRGNREQTSTT